MGFVDVQDENMKHGYRIELVYAIALILMYPLFDQRILSADVMRSYYFLTLSAPCLLLIIDILQNGLFPSGDKQGTDHLTSKQTNVLLRVGWLYLVLIMIVSGYYIYQNWNLVLDIKAAF